MLNLDGWNTNCPQCKEVQRISSGKEVLEMGAIVLLIIGGAAFATAYLANKANLFMAAGVTAIFFALAMYAWMNSRRHNDLVHLVSEKHRGWVHLHFDPLLKANDGLVLKCGRELIEAWPEMVVFRMNSPQKAGATYFSVKTGTWFPEKDWRAAVNGRFDDVTFTDQYGNRLVWKYVGSLPFNFYMKQVARYNDVTRSFVEVSELRKAFETYYLLAHAAAMFMEETGAVKRSKPLEEAYTLLQRGLANVPQFLGFMFDEEADQQRLYDNARAYVRERRTFLGLTYGPKNKMA